MRLNQQAGIGQMQGADVDQSASTGTGVLTGAQATAIADKKYFEEQLIGNDIDQEVEADELEDDVDGPDELTYSEPDLELPNEDLTGHPAESGAGSTFEPQDREDLGDSDSYLADGDLSDVFDQEKWGILPRISAIPRRPIVRFVIDADYSVRALDLLDDPHFELRRLLASAVATHLKRHNIVLSVPGDWCRIPAIGSDDELLRLAAAGGDGGVKIVTLIELRTAVRRAQKATQTFKDKCKAAKNAGQFLDPNVQKDEETRLKKVYSQQQQNQNEHLQVFSRQFQAFHLRLKEDGAHLKSMGIYFPCGDVVTVAALMDPARERKGATLAAAFRNSDRRPSELAGEKWESDDWAGFKESQRKAKYRKKKGS